jgi:acetyl-CoA carboxylase carboxyl transferase subunit beta
MAWFRKPKQPLKSADRRDLPSDVFDKCGGCGEIVYGERLAKNAHVCPECGFHFRISPDQYLEILLDPDTFQEHEPELQSRDPLEFEDLKPYPVRLETAENKLGKREGVVIGEGVLDGIPVCVGIMDFRFLGGSMGSVVGEKVARITRRALELRRPLVMVSASGGARMQEGIYSLMQLAKTSTVLARFHDAGLPYISILTDPTTGGTTASFAMLGDTNLAEPGALIGFAGPRVIEETIKQGLPEGFQRSEFLLEHGMVDKVVDRREIKTAVALLLRHMWTGWEGVE